MERILRVGCFVWLCTLFSCIGSHTETYQVHCAHEVERINRMPLSLAYLVPVDSLGHYVDAEIVFSGMYDRCELVADVKDKQVYIFAAVYFDKSGKVRKQVRWFKDGGDLLAVIYYNEQGTAIYAVYGWTGEDHGRLYLHRNKIYVDHSFSTSYLNDRFLWGIHLTTENLAEEYNVNLEMPEQCESVTFAPARKGDCAYLCASYTYASPGKRTAKGEGLSPERFGSVVRIDTIENSWCKLSYNASDEPMGYVHLDSLEIIRR